MDACNARLLALLFFLSLAYCTMAKKGSHIKDHLDFEDKMANKTKSAKEQEKEKLLELLTNEGKPGWFEKAKKMAEEKGKKMKEKGEIKPGKTKEAGNSTILLADHTVPPSQMISSISSTLTEITSQSTSSSLAKRLATRVRTTVTGLNDKWSDLSDDDRESIAGTVGVISGSIDKFVNAGDDPVAAVRAGIDILGSIAGHFGPKGQMVAMGLSFVSSLLGLFGKGTTPKSMDQVVREQVNQALEAYRDQDLSDKANGLIEAFRQSKAYLDGAAESGNPLNQLEWQLASDRVPITQGSEFLGELSSVILRMLNGNKASDAKKCIKYCELYASLAALRDMILSQFISMASDVSGVQNDVNGLIGYRQSFRDGTRLLFEKLYTINYFSQIMPYFDPDVSPVTDKYSTIMLDLGKYDRSMAGVYCFRRGNSDLDWTRRFTELTLWDGKPYTTMKVLSISACYWKLVPHGQNIYSIVNKYKCDENNRWCDAMLSYDSIDGTAWVGIDHEDPVLWELPNNRRTGIRNKWHCPSDGNCNKELKLRNRRTLPTFPAGSQGIYVSVGHLGNQESSPYWTLRKKP